MEYGIRDFYQRAARLLFRFGKSFFIACPFLLLLLLLITGFFQHPAVDDFGVFNLTSKYGRWGAIEYFFKEGDSRYFSMPVLFLITSSRFLLDHYFIIVASLFILTFLAIFFFTSEIANFFLIRPPVKMLLWLSALLMLIFVSSVIQISSLLYWWSAALTYLLPFDIFILYVLFFLKFLVANIEKEKRKFFLILVILSFLLCGSNEELGYFTVAGMGLYFLYQFLFFGIIDKKVVSLLIADLLFVMILFFGPGEVKRAGGYMSNGQSVVYSLISAFYQSSEMFAVIFSNPFFWLGFIFLFFAHSYLRVDIRTRISAKRNFFLEVWVLYVTVFIFYFIVRAFGGWVLHERANNAVILIAVTWLFMIAVRNGKNRRMLLLALFRDRFVAIAKFLLIIFLLFNSFTQNIARSIWAGYYHNLVLNERVARIEKAKLMGLHSITIPSYKETLDSLLMHKYKYKWARFLEEKLVFPPPYLYFMDDPWFKEADFQYAEFYGIDTIIVGNRKVIRFGLQ